jgi:hypothetical protein
MITMRMTDSMILNSLLPLQELPGWQVLGASCYITRTPGQPIQVVITVHRGASTATPLGLRLRAVHLQRGELDATVLPFDQNGDPWQVAAFNFTTATVRPGPEFAGYFDQIRAYRALWQDGGGAS